MDYRSPIEIYTHEPIFKEMEDGIMRATVSCGVQIDKDELIRALAYDREQYRYGYESAERKYKRPEGEWINKHEWANGFYERECSICGAMKPQLMHTVKINFCPNCGAKMKGADDD